jgi:hypothetical protein
MAHGLPFGGAAAAIVQPLSVYDSAGNTGSYDALLNSYYAAFTVCVHAKPTYFWHRVGGWVGGYNCGHSVCKQTAPAENIGGGSQGWV